MKKEFVLEKFSVGGWNGESLVRSAALIVGMLGLAWIISSNANTQPSEAFVDNGLPVGMVVPFAGATNKVPVESGWELCDGKIVAVEEYPQLYERIGMSWGSGEDTNSFRLPDLRGRFLRGVDHTSEAEIRDPGRDERMADYAGGNEGNKVGSIQDDMVGPHSHDILGVAMAFGLGDGRLGQYLRFFGYKSPNEEAPEYTVSDLAVESSGDESRPKNAAVNWIIKAK
ncbi:MAG: phage tail protein [Verrucomicrobia bacterium]|nr:phage tail protein [Verrucomicrobiota bacterium]MCF7709441.1 phage tail protein [Verrucomicrobiota bacterium]